MGPPTKKRKEPPSNRTLLDFFSGVDTAKRARVRSSQETAFTSVRHAEGLRVASREIIVIDSDVDDDDYTKENEKTNTRLDSMTGLRFFKSPTTATSTAAHLEDDVTFGMPSELLRPISLCAEASSNQSHSSHHSTPTGLKPDHSGSMFGVSAPLLEQTSIEEEPTERSEESMSVVGGGNSAHDDVVEFPIGEWAAGDDERVALEVLDNSAEVDEGEHSDNQRNCPLCGINLAGVLICEAQSHVNQCLDTSSRNDDVKQEYTSVAKKIDSDATFKNSGFSAPIKDQGGDLYTILMNSYKDNEVWAEADVTADQIRPTRGNRRKAPFYKILQGMPIAVDAFCYGPIPGVTAYFLTHAHSDHYTNLGSKWKSGPIYCSDETANLIIHMLAVDPKWIHPLPLDTPTMIPNTGGVSVTLIEANHCPGSCLFFFEGQQTVDAGDSAFRSQFVGSARTFRYLHCGDFRASPHHILHPAVKGKYIDHIYLDTTYLDPKFMFSPQPLVISACAELARRLVGAGAGDNRGIHASRNFTIDDWMKSSTSPETGGQQVPERILVIVGTYSVGKERIVKAIAQALETKIYCDSRKTAILRCQADKELHALLTTDPAEANVHILPLGTVTSDNLRSYLERFKGTFSRIIGFRPTGWTYSSPFGRDPNASIRSIISRGQLQQFSYTDLRPSPKSSYNIQIYGVPYSEHSSFFELTCFALSCNWGRMIPTVNVGSPTSRAKMTKWLKRWELERRCIKPCLIQPRTADYW